MFLRRLDRLLTTAEERGIVTSATSASLRSLAGDQDRERGVLTLAATLGWLGGGIAALGSILLIATNWAAIPDALKIVGFLALLAAPHAAGFWIRKAGLPYDKTAEALHFLGAGLFIAGVGLIAQIFNLNSRPPNGVLLWFVAVAPLAVLLRSAPLTGMSLFALLLWLHLETGFAGSPLEMNWTFTTGLALEIGLGTALIGFSGPMTKVDPRVAGVFRGFGVLLLFSSLYLLGFYRFFSAPLLEGPLLVPWIALGLGGVGLTVGARYLAPESPWLRNRLVALLAATVVLVGAMLAADALWLPRGPELSFFDFGWERSHDAAEWGLSVIAWAAWFGLALWSIGWGARADRKGYVNLGVLAVGIGIMTRFFDLIGGMEQTGVLFLGGGLLLVGTGFAMERWRRKIVLGIKQRSAA